MNTFIGALKTAGLFVAKFAGYSAAYPTNTTQVGQRMGLNSNTGTASIQRLGMSFTADMVCKDNPLCTAYLTQRQNYCSSTMIYLPGTPDEGLNAAITQYLHGYDGCGGVFATMGMDCSMQDAFMRTADLECPVKGDSAMVNYQDAQGDIRLMEVSADQIGEVYAYTPIRRCSLEKQVYRDSAGNVERIEIKEVSGNDCTYYGGRYFHGPDCIAYKIYERQEHWYGNPRIYDASDVHYFRDPASYRGYRGVTLFHTALPYMQKSDDLLTAALGIAQRQARTSAYIYNNSGGPTPGQYDSETDYTGRVTYSERAGSGPFEEYHFIGDSVVPNTPNAPGTDVINGIEASDERVALGLRMTFAFLINSAKLGGVTARGETQKVWKEFSRIQTMIHRPRFRRIVDQVLMSAVRRGILDVPRGMTSEQFLRGRAMLPTSPVTDAFNDARENIDMVREGLESPQDIIAETNRDWRDVVRKSGEWREAVELEAWKRTQNLKAAGCDGIVSPQEISATSDNPQQAVAEATEEISGEGNADVTGTKATTAGILIRAGFLPDEALRIAGLPHMENYGLKPVTLAPEGGNAPVGQTFQKNTGEE